MPKIQQIAPIAAVTAVVGVAAAFVPARRSWIHSWRCAASDAARPVEKTPNRLLCFVLM
jgi:hypothetical protein